MANILSSKKSTYGSPYAYYTFNVTEKSRTPDTVTLVLKATGHLQYSNSYLLTGSGYGLIAGLYIAGAWRTWTLKSEGTSWRGTTKHSASRTITLPADAVTESFTAKARVLRSNSSYKPASLSATTCSKISITNVTEQYAQVTADAQVISQAEVDVLLTGLPASVGYATCICWYKDGELIATTPIASNATTTEYVYRINGLRPSTTYNLMAEIRSEDESGTVLATHNVAVTTDPETAVLDITPKATYLVLNVSGMFDLPNYTRTLEVWYKKKEDTLFKLASVHEVQTASTSINVTRLSSNQEYDIRVDVKSADTVLLSLAGNTTTLTDTSLVPTGIIDSITQRLGSRECTVHWTTDKLVAGTTYEIQAKVAGDSEWITLVQFDELTSPAVVVAPDGNVDVDFRVISWNFELVDDTVNHSDPVRLYVRDDFVWDVDKVTGAAFYIAASEWNRLREYVVARNADIGVIVDIKQVRAGDSITAVTYNAMKNAINNVTAIDIADKKRGEAITASDIDALRIAINTVE